MRPGFSTLRTELLHFVVVPATPPHPVQVDCQLPRHRHLGDLPSAPHGQVKKLAAPLRIAAHRHLRGFHQQEVQQRVALLADVAQPSPVSAGFLRRHQPHVAGDLLRALEAFRRSDH
jgi:hypothetical protein